MTTEKMIYGKMIEVVKRITKVGKTQKNTQQGFMFRGIDDVQNALNGIMGEVGVVCVPVEVEVKQSDRVSSKGTPMIHARARVKYRFYAEDGSFIDANMEGEAIDSGDKSTSKAISIAYKYLLLETFMIPTEEQKDPDHESHELAKPAPPIPTTGTATTAGQSTKPAPAAKAPIQRTVLKKDTEQYLNAVKHLATKEGAKMPDIHQHYIVSPDVEKALIQDAAEYEPSK